IDPLAPAEERTAQYGTLHRLDLDGADTVLADDVMTSNGLACDADDGVMYHVDTPRRLVWRFPVDTVDGREREQFVSTEEYEGEPDGLAVAADGSVWVAMAGGSVVVAWDAGGRRMAEIEVPQVLATAVAFGGDDLRSLYVLTGSSTDHPDPAGGSVYVMPAPVAGLPGAVAKVRLPAA
ncbi:MAG: hypothetical protein QOG64_1063, partial [Acidimicrobiaceae bacterium]|nr:hypothetical protein [Acidimicrobiaceae bacterium]